ncbi:hypothetical protein B0H17DRAFT_1207885 [Mycena rosella]|uniref:Uncharacterized protein n=1 Tax=Mycena rosella TaxID=1033263 RepID=A0AAD7D1W8_MYCRO|nr:hypothetical protein B0H17DRAFT_1207885 [Mycena rosella]
MSRVFPILSSSYMYLPLITNAPPDNERHQAGTVPRPSCRHPARSGPALPPPPLPFLRSSIRPSFARSPVPAFLPPSVRPSVLSSDTPLRPIPRSARYPVFCLSSSATDTPRHVLSPFERGRCGVALACGILRDWIRTLLSPDLRVLLIGFVDAPETF